MNISRVKGGKGKVTESSRIIYKGLKLYLFSGKKHLAEYFCLKLCENLCLVISSICYFASDIKWCPIIGNFSKEISDHRSLTLAGYTEVVGRVELSVLWGFLEFCDHIILWQRKSFDSSIGDVIRNSDSFNCVKMWKPVSKFVS